MAAPAVERVEVVRGGSALRLFFADGTTRIVRDKEIGRVPCEPRPELPRFADARPEAGGVAVYYVDGGRRLLPARALVADTAIAAQAAPVELVLEGIGRALTCDGSPDDPLGSIEDAAVCIARGRIVWIGPRLDLPRTISGIESARRIDLAGRLLSPGLVDPHTHPVFAGNRADEFARRAAGQSYQQIAAAGGGIIATLGPTRAATLEQHVGLTCARMMRALAWGTTTSEAKSGYALTVAGELKLLETIAVVDALAPVDLVPTLLGAHLVPQERRSERGAYVREVIDQMIPAVVARELATSVDVYCDEGAFTLAETEAVLRAARVAGLAQRAHVGQFADLGGAQLLAELGALSADHLEQVSPDGIAALAGAGVVAVMLPGACVQLRMAPPPVEALRAAGVAMAIGTDLNPGTSHSESLPLQMWLATTHYGMTVEEAWLGVTRNAARAIARADVGCLCPGARADLVSWDAEHPGEIPYHYGVSLIDRVIKAGRVEIDRAEIERSAPCEPASAGT